LEFFTTNSLSWEQLEYNTENLYNLHYGLIHRNAPTQINTNNFQLPNIREEFILKTYTLCQDGDVAFADASEDTNDVAKAVEFFNCNDKKIVCGLHTIHGRDKLNITVKGFKGYAFSSAPFHNQINRLAQGTKVYSISQKNFNECFIGIPSKEEQTKIAHLLHLIDVRVSTQSQIIDNLQSLIKVVCKVHHNSVKKTEYKIVDLGMPFRVMNLSKDDLSSEGEKCILYGELFTVYNCVIDEVMSFTECDSSQKTLSGENDLLFPASTTVDSLSLISPSAISIKNVILGGDMFGIRLHKSFNNKYISYVINYIYKRHLAKYAQGSTIIHLYYDNIKDIKIMLPNFETQCFFVDLMTLLRNKIKNEQNLFCLYQKQKKYLLNQMFI
jgi:type I restriction enzyme S subunit